MVRNQSSVLRAAVAALAVSFSGCVAEDAPVDGEDRLLGSFYPCGDWHDLVLGCGTIGLINGAAGGGVWFNAGFYACAASLGFFTAEQVHDAFIECSDSLIPPASGGEITGHEGVECHEPENIAPLCLKLIEGRDTCFMVNYGKGGKRRRCRPCGEKWTDECDEGVKTCIENTEENCEEEIEAAGLGEIGDPGHDVVNDVDGDGEPSTADVQAIYQRFGSDDARADFDGNGIVDAADVDVYVQDVLAIAYGDVNLDGHYNSSDLVEMFTAGAYEQDVEAGWGEGDFDGDGRFTTSDLVLAQASGCYEAEEWGCIIAETPE